MGGSPKLSAVLHFNAKYKLSCMRPRSHPSLSPLSPLAESNAGGGHVEAFQPRRRRSQPSAIFWPQLLLFRQKPLPSADLSTGTISHEPVVFELQGLHCSSLQQKQEQQQQSREENGRAVISAAEGSRGGSSPRTERSAQYSGAVVFLVFDICVFLFRRLMVDRVQGSVLLE